MWSECQRDLAVQMEYQKESKVVHRNCHALLVLIILDHLRVRLLLLILIYCSYRKLCLFSLLKILQTLLFLLFNAVIGIQS